MGHGAELNGDIGNYYCSGSGGSRPAFLISSSLTVEAEDTNPWSSTPSESWRRSFSAASATKG